MKPTAVIQRAATALVILGAVSDVWLYLPRASTPSVTLADEMLATIRGGFDITDGPGQSPQRHCKISPANCTVSKCTTPGNPCTSCVPGPGSALCADVPSGTPCRYTHVVRCRDAKMGACTTADGRFIPAGAHTAQRGAYYQCR